MKFDFTIWANFASYSYRMFGQYIHSAGGNSVSKFGYIFLNRPKYGGHQGCSFNKEYEWIFAGLDT